MGSLTAKRSSQMFIARGDISVGNSIVKEMVNARYDLLHDEHLIAAGSRKCESRAEDGSGVRLGCGSRGGRGGDQPK
jgi:hypothetical protein